MIANFTRCAVLVALCSFYATSDAAADLVVNGSFEAPIATSPPGYSSPPLFNGNLPGWTIEGGTNVETISSYWPAYDGQQSLDLDGYASDQPSNGTISQVLATVPGQAYLLSFVYGNNYAGSNPFPPSALVTLVDATPNNSNLPLLSQTITHSTSVNGDMHWTSFFDVFVAISDSTKLTFASLDATSSPGGIALDAVSVNAVPEPTTMVTWALFAVSVGACRLRRRRQTV
jgi:hypothetical protein